MATLPPRPARRRRRPLRRWRASGSPASRAGASHGWRVVGLAAWIVIAFAGQAAAAAQATDEVAEARARNVAAAAETDALRRELEMVTQERWILQQARAYQLGSRKERPFALAQDAPALPPDAPGSQARRLGAEAEQATPLEAWLDVLFGPAPDR